MNAAKIVAQLNSHSSESYKRVLMKHGAKEPVLGVKISDLKKIAKQVGAEHELVLELYDTGIYDAQYLAGLAVDAEQMTKKDLRHWLAKANCSAISGSVVAWVTAESRYGAELATAWTQAKKELSAHAGWTTWSSLVSIRADADLDHEELKRMLTHVEQTIHQQPNLVRYAMNGFVIAVGCYISDLTDAAIRVGKSIGQVTVDMGDTACEVPAAVAYVQKVQQRRTIGKKRKSARC